MSNVRMLSHEMLTNSDLPSDMPENTHIFLPLGDETPEVFGHRSRDMIPYVFKSIDFNTSQEIQATNIGELRRGVTTMPSPNNQYEGNIRYVTNNLPWLVLLSTYSGARIGTSIISPSLQSQGLYELRENTSLIAPLIGFGNAALHLQLNGGTYAEVSVHPNTVEDLKPKLYRAVASMHRR